MKMNGTLVKYKAKKSLPPKKAEGLQNNNY